MTNLKLIGEFNCGNCNKPIKIDSNVGICDKNVWNVESKKCPYCNYLNIVTVDIARDNGQISDKGSKYYEDIGRDFTTTVRLFSVKSGEIDGLPLWYAVSLMHIARQILKYDMFEYMTSDTYPMYNIRNRYIGYVDEERKFQDKRCFKDKILDFIENLIK